MELWVELKVELAWRSGNWLGRGPLILFGGAIIRELSSFRACVGRGRETHDEQSEAL